MPPVDFATIEGLRAQFERPLIIGLVAVYLIHVFAVARYAMPMVTVRNRGRFLVGMTAAFAVFVLGAGVAYYWILRWLAEAMLTTFLPLMLYEGGFCSQALWLCLGAGMLCEIPVLTFVCGRFGIPVLQKREGYFLILLLSVVMPPMPDFFPGLVISIPSIILYELGLGALRLQRFRRKPDDERYAY